MSKTKSAVSFSRKQIFQIAKAYALSDYSHVHFEKEFHCSSHTFYKLLHLAVEQCIVDDRLAQKIMEKASENSRKKMLEKSGSKEAADCAAARVRKSWQKEIKQRRFFTFTKKDTQKIVTQYATNSLSKNEFCKRNYISPVLFDRTLKKAIINSWISDELVAKLLLKAEQFHGKCKADSFFQALIQKRNMSKS